MPAEHFNTSATCITTTITTTAYCTFPVITATIAVTTTRVHLILHLLILRGWKILILIYQIVSVWLFISLC